MTVSTKHSLDKPLEKKGLAGRFSWLLETIMRRQGIDVQELDRSLTYWETKAEIEAKYRNKLVFKMEKLSD